MEVLLLDQMESFHQVIGIILINLGMDLLQQLTGIQPKPTTLGNNSKLGVKFQQQIIMILGIINKLNGPLKLIHILGNIGLTQMKFTQLYMLYQQPKKP